jgi:cullin-associated NEDD8-dissociated protein 1
MNEVSDQNAKIIIEQLYPIILKGINAKEEDIVEEFVDLLSEMIKKFMKILIANPDLINQKAVLENLNDRLKTSSNLPLNKKIT